MFLQAKQRFIFGVSENAFRFGSDPNVSAKRMYGKKTVPIWMSMFTLAFRRVHFRACTAYQCHTTGSEKYLIICAHPSTVYACDESHRRVSCFYPKEKKNTHTPANLYAAIIGNYVPVTSIFIFSSYPTATALIILLLFLNSHRGRPRRCNAEIVWIFMTRNCVKLFYAMYFTHTDNRWRNDRRL